MRQQFCLTLILLNFWFGKIKSLQKNENCSKIVLLKYNVLIMSLSFIFCLGLWKLIGKIIYWNCEVPIPIMIIISKKILYRHHDLVQTRTTLNLFIVYLFIYFGKLFSLTDPHFISKRKIINYVYEVNPLYPFFLRSYQHVMS